jgi:hypothetical protein
MTCGTHLSITQDFSSPPASSLSPPSSPLFLRTLIALWPRHALPEARAPLPLSLRSPGAVAYGGRRTAWQSGPPGRRGGVLRGRPWPRGEAAQLEIQTGDRGRAPSRRRSAASASGEPRSVRWQRRGSPRGGGAQGAQLWARLGSHRAAQQ